MNSEAWVFAAFALMALLHLGLVLYWRQRSASASGERPRRPAGENTSSAAATDGEPAVWCPDCGEPNQPGYHYCRRCVSELGGGQRSAPEGSDSSGVF